MTNIALTWYTYKQQHVQRTSLKLSRTEYAVYLYIQAHPRTTRAIIDRDECFSDMSLSTLKRTVNRLHSLNLITATPSKRDRRQVELTA